MIDPPDEQRTKACIDAIMSAVTTGAYSPVEFACAIHSLKVGILSGASGTEAWQAMVYMMAAERRAAETLAVAPEGSQS